VTTVAARAAPSASQSQPGAWALAIYRGDSAAWQVQLWQDSAMTQPVDLTGVIVAAQIRATPDSETAISLTTVVTLPNTIGLSLSAADSANVLAGVWDLELTYPNGTVTTVLAGPVVVTPDVTRP
jgi:hypothetical protein